MKKLLIRLLLSVLASSWALAGPGNSKLINDSEILLQPKIKLTYGSVTHRIEDYEILDLSLPTCFLKFYTTNGEEFFVGTPTGTGKAAVEDLLQKIEAAASENQVEIVLAGWIFGSRSSNVAAGILEEKIYVLKEIIIENHGIFDFKKALRKFAASHGNDG